MWLYYWYIYYCYDDNHMLYQYMCMYIPSVKLLGLFVANHKISWSRSSHLWSQNFFSLRPWKQQLVKKKYLVISNLSNECLNNKIIKYWSFINISWTTLIFCEFHCWVDWNLIYIKVQFMYLFQLYWKNDWLKSNTNDS